MNGAIVIVILAIAAIFFLRGKRNKKEFSKAGFKPEWRKMLEVKVPFYSRLDASGKARFESRILQFFDHVKITGIETQVTLGDRLLVASGGVIPLFFLEDAVYPNLSEVLIYPDKFNFEHEFKGKSANRKITGMVGTGYMNGTMILAQPYLRGGFKNEKDRDNVAIHEFIHLFDGMDGSIDGVPSAFLEQPMILPWMSMIKEEIDDIKKRKSDIDPYGGTNPQEFLAVTGEYFFENPQRMKKEHPELYKIMLQIFT